MCSPANVKFRYGRTGKPELSPEFRDTGLQFNLSHSHGQLLVGIARRCAIGVDIEMIRPDTDIEKIAERFFSFAETEQLRAVNGLGKRTAFFNGWTRKEAYLKARGEGIGEGLDQFAVSLLPGMPARLLFDRRDPGAVSRWSIHDLADHIRLLRRPCRRGTRPDAQAICVGHFFSIPSAFEVDEESAASR